MTLENYETEMSKHGELTSCMRRQFACALKVNDLHNLGRKIANGNGLECIYPPADPEALAKARASWAKQEEEKRKRTCEIAVVVELFLL